MAPGPPAAPSEPLPAPADLAAAVVPVVEAETRAPLGRPAVATRAHGTTLLSLYEGDLLNRLWAAIGLGPRRPAHLALRALLLPLLTWFPTALLFAGTAAAAASRRIDASNYFADFAAYAQFWLGLPLFVLAEAIVSISTRSASLEFAASGVIRRRDLARFETLHWRFNRLARHGLSDLLCVFLGGALSFATIWPELHHAPAHATWHTIGSGRHYLSAAGYWEFCLALPLLNYWWLRHAWKVILWWQYLRALSRFRLDLVATHPDATGGIGFISSVQAHFAWLLLAYGVTNVAATVGYELALEGADLWSPPVWGPVLGFMIGGPLLFLLPLFMFTRQLYRTKRSARRLYRRRVMEQARLFEAEVLPRSAVESATMTGALDLSLMAQFSRLFESAQQMRVVPFDWRSVSQLVGSTFGSVASILPALHLQGPLASFFALAQKIMLSLGSAH
ncbi:MAG TPA: hypothetical protein VFO44_08180 [Steroidobacteraceae bacterium]|nr:hypothetical protein [Steroidobacteraceae bacterium]